MSAIISWIATQPEVRLDGPGDPRLGMVGVSYGGGIQLVTAANDQRVDAIVPDHRLEHPEQFAVQERRIQEQLGNPARRSPHSDWRTHQSADCTRRNLRRTDGHDDAERPADLLADRGPGDSVKITAPTLLIQGTVDTLFPLQEADTNAADADRQRRAHQGAVVLRRPRLSAPTIRFDLRDGALIKQRHDGVARPLRQGRHVSSHRPAVRVGRPTRAVLLVEHVSGAAGPTIVTSSTGESTSAACSLRRRFRSRVRSVLPLWRHVAVNLKVPAATSTTYLVGAPKLTLTYSGTGSNRPRLRPARRQLDRVGAGQPGHPDTRDVGREYTHDHPAAGTRLAHAASR